MSDLERAYSILHLPAGASIKEIIEARDDLLYLWDPHRLTERPSLRSKAAVQQQAIREAAALLLEQLSEEAGQPLSEGLASTQEATGTGSPSLYDEVFSRRRKKKISGLTVVVMAGLAISLMVAVFLALGVNQQAAEPTAPPEVSRQENPATPPLEPSSQEEKPEQPSEPPDHPAPEKKLPPPSEAAEKPAVSKSENPARPQTVSAQIPANQAQPAAPERPQGSQTNPKRPVLIRGQEPPEKSPQPTPAGAAASQSAPSESPSQVQPAPDIANKQEIFDFLLEKSRAARMLAGGSFSDLPFAGWEIRDQKGEESYVDLTVDQQGTTIHFIWGVSSSGEKVQPLSQAARDLEARVP